MPWLLFSQKAASPWLPQRVVRKQYTQMDLVVRTVNTWEGGARKYPKRLRAAAREFRSDWPNSIGLIGMQEVKEEMRRCPVPPKKDHGAHCFGRILSEEYGIGLESVSYDKLGIIVGEPWRIVSIDGWEIGKDPIWGGDKRYLLEAKTVHPQKGVLSFYSTHLTHPPIEPDPEEEQERIEERSSQIAKLTSRIRDSVKANELPPIIVGDFNFANGHPNFLEMAANFRFLGGSAYDHIWVGSSTSFPGTRGSFTAVRSHITLLTREYVVDGDTLPQISDHDSFGMGFKVE